MNLITKLFLNIKKRADISCGGISLSGNIGHGNNMGRGCGRKVAAAVVLMAVSLAADADPLNLPIKVVDGVQYYYREVKPKETIYGLCRELGLSKGEIVRYNPTVGDGLKAGVTLYFPVADFGVAGKPEVKKVYLDQPKRPEVTADVHLVEKGETIYGISRQYGVSEERLMAANPQLSDGLKAGTLLNIPSEGEEDKDFRATKAAKDINATKDINAAEEEPVAVATGVLPETPGDANVTSTANGEGTSNGVALAGVEESVAVDGGRMLFSAEEDSIGDGPVKIAVILPFMLNDSEPDKQTQLYTEFFKGMLLAADSLKNNRTEIVLTAYDSADNTDTVRAIIGRNDFEGTDFIIAPDNDEQLALLAGYARDNDATILNIFAVKNNDYERNPNIMQANIPHSKMYQQAMESFIEEFDGYTPVILTAEEGKHDKDEFVNLLKYRLNSDGKAFETINYSGYLKSSDFERLNPETRYVFVPVSGAVSEFNRIISALKNYRDTKTDYRGVRLFGYPEWITFRGDALENLHAMDATVYSRFFNDESDLRSKRVAHKFATTYGEPMMTAVPAQGMLGFDTAYFLLSAIDDDINVLDGNTFYNGVQSGFHFVSQPGALGKVNDLLYFVTFRPSGLVDKRVLQ